MNSGEFFDLSDERDRQLALRLDAWCGGYREGARGQYEAGYAAAIADVKAAQHGLYNHLRGWHEFEERRWGPGGRAHFADLRPGDYPGKKAAA